MHFLPQKVIEQSDPEQVELRRKFLEWWHKVSEKAEINVVFLVELEHLHELYVLQVCIDGHIEVVEVRALLTHQLLIELRIFHALLNNVGLAVRLVLHHLLRKIHRFDCFDYYIIVS
jgi:hypothetical protein